MDATELRDSIAQAEPPPGLSRAREALWWDARGDWERAHRCAMAASGPDGAAVHANLHRKEGDPSNARYWYARAGKPPEEGTLEAEWETLAQALA